MGNPRVVAMPPIIDPIKELIIKKIIIETGSVKNDSFNNFSGFISNEISHNISEFARGGGTKWSVKPSRIFGVI